MLALVVPSVAQKLPDPEEEEIVRLSPFAVEERADIGRYQAEQVSSGSRIRRDLMDSTQSISVLTNEFINDIGTARVLDAVKYVAGVGSGVNPDLNDLIAIRGFLNGSRAINGISANLIQNIDPIIIDRVEVVKGPNAIISPAGSPGGLVNNVTKRPLFINKGHLSYQVGRYDSNRAEVDANYVVRPNKLAVRIVAAFTDADSYAKHKFYQNVTVMPMFTYRISPTSEFTAQFHAVNGSVVDAGTMVSLYAVGRSNIRTLDGAPRNFGLVGRNINRHENAQIGHFLFTAQITDKLSTRLTGRLGEYRNTFPFQVPSDALDVTGAPGEVVKLNHITGQWEWDGVTRNDNPRYTFAGGKEWGRTHRGHIQNDFVFDHSGTSWKSQTIAGWALNYSGTTSTRRSSLPDATLYDFTAPNYTPPTYTLSPVWALHSSLRNRSNQAYLYQIVNLFDDHLVLSGSLSQNRYFNDTKNNLSSARTQQKSEATLLGGGFVYKVTPGVSIFYGYSEQEVLGAANPNAGIPAHTRPSRQHEVGVRLKLFDGRLYTTFSYFDILQDNLYTSDWRNFRLPLPDLPYPAVRSNRSSKGFEFEFTWSPTKSLSIIGSYTDFENRDTENMRLDNVAERMAALWGSYTFSEKGPLRGLTVGLGVNYVGERPSDSNGFWTSPPPGFDPVRVQPVVWLPAYTHVEANVSYRFSTHWKAQLTVHNLLNEDYIISYGSGGVRIAWVSTPINPRLTLRYEF